MFTESIDRTTVVVAIIIGATLLSAWIIKSGVPQAMAEYIVASGLKPWQFLLVMNVLLLFLGMFLEGVAIILIVLPVVAPVIRQLGIEPEHFAIVMVINIELALLSPPVGLNLFVIQSLDRAPLSVVAKGALPFVAIMLGSVFLIALFPQIVLAIPGL